MSLGFCVGVVSDNFRLRRQRHCCRSKDSSIYLAAKRSGSASTAKVAEYVDITEGEYDLWKLDSIPKMLKEGALGIIPTDSSYSFVCTMSNREGMDRIYQLKNLSGTKKPLSLICSNLSMVQKYTHSIDKPMFKMLRAALPGPYTFILPANSSVPRVILEHKVHRKVWKRREVGIRVPNDMYCLAILEQLEEPLLVSSIQDEENESKSQDCPGALLDRWGSSVDFIVGVGERKKHPSTIIDCTKIPYEVIREGSGDLSILPD